MYQINLNSIYYVALLSAMLLAGCEKEAVQPASTPADTVSFRNEEGCDCDAKIAAVESDGNILYFANPDDFFAVEGCLKQRVDEHISAFDEAHFDLDDEAFNLLAEELGFDENEPLAQQEAAWGITSLRAVIDEAVDNWMATSPMDVDIATYPDNCYILSDPLRSLINLDGKVNIGGEEKDFSDLRSAKKKDRTGECRPSGYERDRFPIGNSVSTSMVGIASVYQVLFYQRAGAKTRSMRWSRNKWVDWRVRGIQAEIRGQYYEAHCLIEDFSVHEWDTAKNRRAHISTSHVYNISTQPIGRIQHGRCDMAAWPKVLNATGMVCI